MVKISVSKARERLSEVVEMSQSEPVVLELYGKHAAVMVSPDQYDEMLEALEESHDVAAFDAAMAEAHCQHFMTWYNEDHVHSGIGYHTPADLHYGRAEQVRELRGAVLLDAYALHPERFVRKIPTPPPLPSVAWINQPVKEVADSLN